MSFIGNVVRLVLYGGYLQLRSLWIVGRYNYAIMVHQVESHRWLMLSIGQNCLKNPLISCYKSQMAY